MSVQTDKTGPDQGLKTQASNVRRGKAAGALAIEARQAHAVARAMLEDGERLLDRARLLQHVRAFGLARNSWIHLNHYKTWYNSSRVGLLQIPTELVDFLLYCARYRPASMLEIGVYTGGTALVSAAFFKALNPDFRMSIVDVQDYMLLPEETVDLLGIDKRIPSTSEDHYGEAFDIVFIDGDHSYEWAKSDYINIGRNARKVCGFHDINAREYRPLRGGAFRYWRELRSVISADHPVYEISHARAGSGVDKDGDWMGIGLIDFSGRSAAPQS